MKFIALVSVALLFTCLKVEARDKWEILVNKKTIFKGNSEDTNPVVFIKSSSLKRSDKITIKYTTENEEADWKRTFLINDEAENNFVSVEINKQSGSASINANLLKPSIDQKKPFYIYTISTPKNKAEAARVRVRRILLCKVEWSK